MKTISASAVGMALIVLGAGTASAQQPRSIDQYMCKDVIREHGADRDVAIAFLHGFLLGKAGGTSFDLDVLHKQTTDFIEHCLDNPREKAVEAMSKVKDQPSAAKR